MAAYQAGDPASFDRLYALLAPPLKRFLASRLLDPSRTDDLLQETFLQMHRARHTYDPSLPVEPWAYAIARHVFLMHCRKAERRPEVPLPTDGIEPSSRVSSAEEAQVARDELAHALQGLTEKRRRAVLLHHRDGLGFEEVGAHLGIRAGAARLHASRGLRKLRELLRRKGR